MATKKGGTKQKGTRRATNGNKTLPGNAVSTDERMTDDQEAMILRHPPVKKKRPSGK